MNSVNNKYDALITSYFDGQCSAEEAFELLSWVAESEDNRLYFKSLKDEHEVWSLTDFAMPELLKLHLMRSTLRSMPLRRTQNPMWFRCLGCAETINMFPVWLPPLW